MLGILGGPRGETSRTGFCSSGRSVRIGSPDVDSFCTLGQNKPCKLKDSSLSLARAHVCVPTPGAPNHKLCTLRRQLERKGRSTVACAFMTQHCRGRSTFQMQEPVEGPGEEQTAFGQQPASGPSSPLPPPRHTFSGGFCGFLETGLPAECRERERERERLGALPAAQCQASVPSTPSSAACNASALGTGSL